MLRTFLSCATFSIFFIPLNYLDFFRSQLSKLQQKYGPIDLTFINIGAYSFEKMGIKKSIYHATPEEALQIGKDLKSKKIIGMHAFTFVLSLEPVWEPYQRFKDGAQKYGFKKEDAVIFKIGEVKKLDELIN